MITPPAYAFRVRTRALRGVPLATLLSCLALTSLPAQTAPSAAGPTGKGTGEETLVLSPFVVSAEENNSWQATSTLAGSRVRADLKDLAQPISVFTSEFLKTIGATDYQQAMLYSVNVENENEFAPDDTEGNSVSSTNQTRVRGLAAATQTRGFFKTNIRGDTYNTERITVASGPNSILFGIGSPAGILDSTPMRANLSQVVGAIGLRVDSNESYRGTVNFGVPIVKDVLAIRFAELKQKTKTFREPEFDDERRHYFALTFKPFKDTTIYGNYEHMTNWRVRARQGFMPDRVSDWIALGKPLYDHTTKRWSTDKGVTWQSRPDMTNWVGGGFSTGDRVFLAGGAQPSTTQGLVWTGMGSSYDKTKVPTVTFKDDSLVDSTINYYGLGDQTKLRSQASSIIVEQKIRDDLYAEFAYSRETNLRDQDDPLRGGLSSIQADVNWYLPYPSDAFGLPVTTGATPAKNPNVGRYYVDSQYLGWTQNLDYTTTRGMLSYTLDAAEKGWNKHLGRYNFGLMWQREETADFTIKRRLTNQGSYVFKSATNPFGGPNSITSRYYLDLPGLGGDTQGVKYPGAFQMPPWNSVIGGSQEAPTKSKLIDTGKLFVAQGYLLDDSLVLTYGYREDRQEAYATKFSQRDPATNLYLLDVPFTAPITQAGITRTYGAVYHTPLKWLSLSYNRSNAFNPQGSYRDWFNRPLPPGTGEGEDYGIQLNLLDGKLTATLKRYTNTSFDTVDFDWYYDEPKWSVVMNMDASWGMVSSYATREGNLSDVNDLDKILTVGTDAVRPTRDFKSEGYEMELFYQPTKQWDIRFTLAESKATTLRVSPYLQNYINSRWNVWQKYFPYKAWGQWDGTITTYADWRTNPNSTGYMLLNYSNALPRVDAFKAEEGSVVTRGRKWRANLMANYRFNGRLEGLSVGGAGRWRSADTIGYWGKPNPNVSDPSVKLLVSDISRPIPGEDILVFDAWIGYERPVKVASHKCTWSTQLNIRNVLNDDDIVPLGAHTDGTRISFARNEPRSFILSTSLRY